MESDAILLFTVGGKRAHATIVSWRENLASSTSCTGHRLDTVHSCNFFVKLSKILLHIMHFPMHFNQSLFNLFYSVSVVFCGGVARLSGCVAAMTRCGCQQPSFPAKFARRHGLHPPFDAAQLSVLVGSLLLMLLSFGVLIPSLTGTFEFVILVVLVLLIVAHYVSFLTVSLIDPVADKVRQTVSCFHFSQVIYSASILKRTQRTTHWI